MPALYTLPPRLPYRTLHGVPASAFRLMTAPARFPAGLGCDDVRTALDGLTGAFEAVEAYRAKLAGDKTVAPETALMRLANFTRKKLDEAFPPVRRAQEIARETSRAMARTIEATFDMSAWPFARVMMAQELRAHLAFLSPKDRAKAVVTALRAGDEETMLAVTVAPARLSGVHPQMWKSARDKLIQTKTPGEAAALVAIDEALMVAEKLEASLLQSVATLVDFEQAEKLKAATAEAV